MRHVIGKKILQVEFDGDEAEARSLQQRLERFCHDCLIPVIEVALNQQAPADEHVFLEELEIDAGTVPLERLELDLAEAIKGEMSRALREQVLSPRGGARRRNKLQAITEAFLHFLENGTLPWWFQLPAGTDLEQALFAAWRDEVLPAGAVAAALEEALPLLRRAEARTRLVLQFSERLLKLLLPYLAPDLALRVLAVLEEWEKVALPAQLIDAMREKLWDQAFTAAAHRSASTEHELVSRAFMELPEALRHTPELPAALERHWPGAARPADPRPVAGSSRDKVREDEEGAAEPAVTTQDGIYLDNGGLVLLHPYLPQLFDGAGISKGNRIVDPDRGVALLHYLASGELEPHEYRLALAKVLCDVPLSTPLARDVELTEDEREECEALLYVMLQHWGALRNSSADGLRGSFLMRPAKLTLRDNDEWLLQVERSSYDILLDQLPWSISMVKLPWMRKLLWVEWN